MICPSCGKMASTWLRNSFSLQGVTLAQSFKGQLRCQQCGILLRNKKYSKQMWYVLVVMVIVMALNILFSSHLRQVFGMGAVAIYWIVLVIMTLLLFVYGAWKFSVLEIVNEDKSKGM
jgi:hypothetical protein